jgi:glycosyltransferase involved in cell wall biosynthesis
MKILIESNPLRQEERTGVAQFIYYWCVAMLAESQQLHKSHSFVFWAPDVEHDPLPPSPNKTFVSGRLLSRGAWETLWGSSRIGALRSDIDIYHVTYTVMPAPRRSRHTKLVVTIYDLAFARYPETLPEWGSLRYLSSCLARQVEEADRIITISESTKRDLMLMLGAPAEKIDVIYPGTDLQAPKPDSAALPQFEALRLPPRYVLCVGTWEPRKNLPRLLQAWHQLRHKLRERDVYLCLCGGKGWKYEEIERTINDLGLKDSVLSLGYVPRELLPHLYANALMFVYPSLYEGFGLPVLEAMSCGTPVITSRASSLPEAAGDAALLIDPESVEAIASAIEVLLGDEELRAQMTAKGFAHARNFSWRSAARETLAVYDSL